MRALSLAATLLLALPVLAGCLDGVPVEPAEVSRNSIPDIAGLTAIAAHAADGGTLPLPAAFEELRFRIAATGFHRGEPTVGVTSSGAIFAPAGAGAVGGSGRVIRSLDHGVTWQDVTDNLLGPKADLDPWIHVDAITDRVFHMPLYVACSWLSWSDDDGESWTPNPFAGCGIPAHDHQKLAAGPPAPGVTTEGYPNVVYYAYNSFRGEGSMVSRSLDGGRTFALPVRAHASDCVGGINGPIHVAQDSTVYLPKPSCDIVKVGVSRDSGATWKAVDVPVGEAGSLRGFHNPMVSTDGEGNAYVVWPGTDSLVYLSRSRDQGETWSEPVRVTPPGVTSTVFTVVGAGDAGRIAVAYLATDADTAQWRSPRAHDADDSARWHLVVTFSENALDEEPAFVSVRVTPEDDPVQIGRIWNGGGTEPSRNLRDFIGITARDGRVYVSFADGCTEGCSSAQMSRDNEVTIAILEEGPSLLADKRLEALVPAQS